MSILPYVAAAGISGLGSYFTEKARESAEREARERDEASRKRARGYIDEGYGYRYTPYRNYQTYEATPYTSRLQPQQQTAISQMLGGQLSPATLATLNRQRKLGMEDIERTAAQRGTPAGGHSALTTQLGADIALRAAQLAEERREKGLQYALPYQQFEAAQFYRPQDIEREEERVQYEFGLADYIRQKEAEQRRRELLAKYA